MTIAIDFGTSNTVIARWNQVTQQPETLALPGLSRTVGDSPPLIPSLVYVQQVEPLQVQIGQAVRDQGLDVGSDLRFFKNFKRGIGTPLQGFLPVIDGKEASFETVGQWFLTQVLQALTKTTGETDSLIFTVPVDSFETYRQWLGQVCEAMAVGQVRMIDEPTAAALGYGLTGGQTLLVVDFGGGTLDLSLVKLDLPEDRKPLGFILKWGNQSMAEKSGQKAQTARVLAKTGENLGGADIDNWLAEHFHQTQGLPLSPVTLRLVERLKIQLSQQPQASEVYFNDETLEAYELALSRDTFNHILQENQFFERLDARLGQILQQARRQGIEAADIDAVLMVGGTTQIPAVQDWIRQTFEDTQVRNDRPFESVAQGALQLQQGIDVKDFLYHSYGVRYWDRRNKRHGWHPIIQQGQPYPMSDAIELTLGASVDQQPSIELVLGELGDTSTRTEVYFEGDRLITRQVGQGTTQVQPLNDREGARTIAQLTPPGFPGNDRIKVFFRVDRDRRLRITVEDLLTGNTLLSDQAVVELR